MVVAPDRAEVVVVTGASAGVGRAVVRRFARERAHIALLARGADGLEAARREVEEAGGRALVLPTDVACWEEVDRAATETEAAFGEIDIWINNAMTSVFSPVREMQPEEYRRVTDVTYLGTVTGPSRLSVACCRAIEARSSKSDRRSRIAVSRCRAPTARPSTRRRDSWIRFIRS